MSPELLRRTRPVSVTLTALLCMWLFGNLYEELVPNLQLIANPRAGTVPDLFAAGSPVFYYLPWAPLTVALTVVLRVRFGAAVQPAVRRAWNRIIGCVVVAVAVKIVLITRINPVFRDPESATQVVHDQAIRWAVGNGLAIVAVAAALVLLATTRLPAEQFGTCTSPGDAGHTSNY